MRIHPRRVLRSVLVVTMLLFVTLNLHILLTARPESSPEFHRALVLRGGGNHKSIFEMHVQFGNNNNNGGGGDSGSPSASAPRYVVPPRPQPYNATPMAINRGVDVANLTAVRGETERINAEQRVHNVDRFGLQLDAHSVVVVIQVHDRHDYLRIVLDSLRRVRNIEHTLLVISHDVYAPELNRVVESIDFCPVMQIFFPHSQQMYPDEFPGESANDCPRDIKKNQALIKKCNNAEHPDKYGHYREAKYCQTKHHWIWKVGHVISFSRAYEKLRQFHSFKLSHVFEGIDVLADYEGMVLLLEDDYFLTEDAITMLQMMHNLQLKDCKDCRMFVIGNYDKVQNYKLNSGKVEKAYWISSRHNMGMVFNRKLWNAIKQCSQQFCLHDDYNWDWTIQHLSMKCIPGKIRLLKMKASRVFHIGECGMHVKGKSCNPDGKLKKVLDLIAKNKQYFFPNVLAVAGESRYKLRDPKANGGWGDKRDHDLCLGFFTNTTVS